jgi:hypothetical protein
VAAPRVRADAREAVNDGLGRVGRRMEAHDLDGAGNGLKSGGWEGLCCGFVVFCPKAEDE